MSQTETESHKARKQHRCDWCWQHIEAGDRYRRYRYFGFDEPTTIKMHPECYDAMLDVAQAEGGAIEWTSGMERPERVADFPEEADK